MPVETFLEIEEGKLTHAFFYSPIFAPLGLEEEIFHHWFHDGKEVSRIDLGRISGGRAEGYRTWSRHMLREGSGEYSVDVWTKSGQLIGRGEFRILPKGTAKKE